MQFVVNPPVQAVVPVKGADAVFPVHRIYCVGKNYAAHIREMGAEPARDAVCFFLKPADAVVTTGRVPYPPATGNLHYEGELVIAIGTGGGNIPPSAALTHVFGYAAGLDMTRRDLQIAAGRIGHPWDTGKAFDYSAPITAIVPVAQSGHFDSGSLHLTVNGQTRQQADIGDLIWKNHEIISELSKLYTLQPGDLIFTGTPAGVGPVRRGDNIVLTIDRLDALDVTIT